MQIYGFINRQSCIKSFTSVTFFLKILQQTAWFKLYFICIIYDKYTNNTEYNYNTTTIQMGFSRKSNDLFESVSQEFTLLIYVLSCRNCHSCRE